MRRLAGFDIDGTLTDTNAVDDECFLRAVADVLGLDPAGLDWSDAPHVTDSGLLRWLVERHRHRHVRAAAAGGLPFVGVASGDQAARLRAAGAATTLPDLADVPRTPRGARDGGGPAGLE